MKKMIACILSVLMLAAALTACGGKAPAQEAADGTHYTVGICNYVDDASLNQIVENLRAQLEKLGEERDVQFDILYDNCNADTNLMSQIISNFQADGADLLVAVATPVAMSMQAATEGTDTPVVFAAVSDPVSVGLVDSLEAPGSNVTGTSDYLDTASVMNLIFAQNPDAKKIGLLYASGRIPRRAPSRLRSSISRRRAWSTSSAPARRSMKLRWPRRRWLRTAWTPCLRRRTTP